MSNLLSTAKQVLIDRATEMYEMRREGLEFDALSYQQHYKDLGAIIFQIDSYKSFGDILNDIEEDNLQEIGYFGADEDVLESFVKLVQKCQ
jgi:hypothetical protein